MRQGRFFAQHDLMHYAVESTLRVRHSLISQFGDAMQDFVENLKEQGLLDRVLILCFSEFGRRVQENASGGTDHG
ncbi:MAG: DUF1501 domain-containing protein, partial [Phycisphaerales bacterium]|nr:DUF1501 domain-containing protein [Phycisphaerales bacterium]